MSPTAPVATFDPAEWLDRFQAVGGWWVISDDRLWLGWRVDRLGPSRPRPAPPVAVEIACVVSTVSIADRETSGAPRSCYASQKETKRRESAQFCNKINLLLIAGKRPIFTDGGRLGGSP